MCKECIENKLYVCECGKEFDNALSFGGHKAKCKEHLKYIEEEREKRRLPNGLFKCENPGCPNEHDGSYGSGLFCSNKCRLSFIGKQAYKTRVRTGKFKSPFKEGNYGYRFPAKGNWICSTCGAVFRTKRERQTHYRNEHYDGKPCKSWNKGLTKEASPAVMRNSISLSKTMKERVKDGKDPWSKKYWTDERRKQKSLEKKKLYSEHPEKHPNRILANNRNKMSYPEKIAFDWLSRNGISFKHQFNFVTEKFTRYIDFFCEDRNIFIEIDGEYWHSDKELDKQKDEDALNHGFQTFRISAKERIEERLATIFQ